MTIDRMATAFKGTTVLVSLALAQAADALPKDKIATSDSFP